MVLRLLATEKFPRSNDCFFVWELQRLIPIGLTLQGREGHVGDPPVSSRFLPIAGKGY